MGEMVINSMRGEIPVVTIRPSVIESTWRDPFPGWMEGNRLYTYSNCFRLSVFSSFSLCDLFLTFHWRSIEPMNSG